MTAPMPQDTDITIDASGEVVAPSPATVALRQGAIGTGLVVAVFVLLGLFAPDVAGEWGPKAVAISIAHVVGIVGFRLLVQSRRRAD